MKAFPIKQRNGGELVATCPSCEEDTPVSEITLTRVIGGEDYLEINEGYWFEENTYDHMTAARCLKCGDFSDWEDWPENESPANNSWECAECGAIWDTKRQGDLCCQ